ncbi:MAG TPA: DUF2117 domain-containing protein [Candidatus Bathyarchaeia archaeon]|nr:DUF2117 domain-containing protein [Candidatus Bathyarchaeia archaeon]
MQKTVLGRALNHPAIGIRLVIHGPELIDSGKIADIVDALRGLGPLRVLAGGTMARVAALDEHLTFVDTSQNVHASDALNHVSDKEVLVLANCGKTSETGRVFGQIVSSRVRRSVIQVERPGLIDGSVILWRGADGDTSSNVQYVARHLSDRLSLKLVKKQKRELSVEQTDEVVTRHIYGARPGEPLLVQGMVVGTVVDGDVAIIVQRGRIVDIAGVATKAHGLEKIGNIDLGTAYIKTGHLRASNEACVQRSMLPARPLQRGSVIFVNHRADETLESVNETTICAITVGDDTTSICGDILSRAGVPIVGITDGDGDGLYKGACEVEGSLVLRIDNASDDDIGLLLERSGELDGGDYTLATVIEIVTNFLHEKGVEFGHNSREK